MNVIFVHGWSVQNTDCYGGLPAYVATLAGPDGQLITVADVYLGRYVSFDDTVTLDDISRAFDQALRDALGAAFSVTNRFACITHSTGGPVVRNWMALYYGGNLAQCPLSHLIMCAPANFGSALAQLGKGVLSRMKSFVGGVEPGQRVLDWLELGSVPAWDLNEEWIQFDCVAGGIYPFTLIGETIDRKFYDVLNSYTDEMGSDGVVRVASGNINYNLVKLGQGSDGTLSVKASRTQPTAFGVLPKIAHAGPDIGIVNSVGSNGLRPAGIAQKFALNPAQLHPTAEWVAKCLQVKDAASYQLVADGLATLTAATQLAEKVDTRQSLLGTRTYPNARCSQVVFALYDDRGDELSDYDLLLTAGPDYSEQELPSGFFVDRQLNQSNPGRLTMFLNWDVLNDPQKGLPNPALQGKFGFRVVARPTMPSAGDNLKPLLAGYRVFNFESTLDGLLTQLRPNETLMVQFTLRRLVDAAVFRMDNNLTPQPIDDTPLNKLVA